MSYWLKAHINMMIYLLNARTIELRLLVTDNDVHSAPILVVLMMEAICSSETSVLNKSHTA
jgi:hypothetical protein